MLLVLISHRLMPVEYYNVEFMDFFMKGKLHIRHVDRSKRLEYFVKLN